MRAILRVVRRSGASTGQSVGSRSWRHARPRPPPVESRAMRPHPVFRAAADDPAYIHPPVSNVMRPFAPETPEVRRHDPEGDSPRDAGGRCVLRRRGAGRDRFPRAPPSGRHFPPSRRRRRRARLVRGRAGEPKSAGPALPSSGRAIFAGTRRATRAGSCWGGDPGLRAPPWLPGAGCVRGGRHDPQASVRRLARRAATSLQSPASARPPCRAAGRRDRVAGRPGGRGAGEPRAPGALRVESAGNAVGEGRGLARDGRRGIRQALPGALPPGRAPRGRGPGAGPSVPALQPGCGVGAPVVRGPLTSGDAGLRSRHPGLRSDRGRRRHGSGLRPLLLPGHGQRTSAHRHVRVRSVSGGSSCAEPPQGHHLLQLVRHAQRRRRHVPDDLRRI